MEIADIIAIRGKGWFSDGIVRATGGHVSHVALVLSVSPSDPMESLVIEALTRVRTRTLEKSLSKAEQAWVLSPLNVPFKTRFDIIDRASEFSANEYGWLELALQLADIALETRWFTDHLAVGLLNRWPICSYCVAKPYWDEGLKFGKLKPQSVTPLDIFEFAVRNADKYSVLEIK